MQAKAACRRNIVLTIFNLGIDKLFDAPTGKTHQMVMMRAFIQLEHRAAALEVIARKQPGLLELS